MKRFLSLTLACITLLATPALAKSNNTPWSPKPGDVIEFDVLRKGKPFGSHSVEFSEDVQGRLVATTDVSLKAGLGPITFFKYDLNATEVWEDGRLIFLKGEVDDDGDQGSVAAARNGDVLAVDGTKFAGQVSASIIPSSHWNFEATRSSKLLSTGNGEILDVAVVEQGRETIRAAGEQVEATRYLLDSDIDVTLWYDATGRWLKLAFQARGQDIEYVLAKPY
jgi:Domain of unknown function (DUF6134)